MILLFTFSILNLNLIFILCYSGGGVLLFVMVYFLNSLFSGKKSLLSFFFNCIVVIIVPNAVRSLGLKRNLLVISVI